MSSTQSAEYPVSIKTREEQEQALRWAIARANDAGHIQPPPDPKIVRWYAANSVAKNMREMAIADPSRLQFPIADVLTLSGKIADGEFDQFFIEQFS